MLETAVIVPVPEASALVDTWRLRYTEDAPLGVPAHITLLYPFVEPSAVDEALLAELRELFAGTPAFDYSLARVARFPDVVYLAPEPAEPFARLTAALAQRYPDYPPYEGAHETVIPHVTVAHGGEALQDAVEAGVASRLPIRARAGAAALLEQLESGRWAERARFPFGPPVAPRAAA